MRRKISKTINDYNIREKKEILNTSFQFRKFFSPLTHYKLSDPTRLESIDQLAFFFDIFHDQRADITVNQLMNGLTEEEFKILQFILKKIVRINKFLKNKSLPYNSILRHLYQHRLLKKLLPECSSFFEIGPGSGFLPIIATLLDKKIKYACTDITHAYFLTQKILYEYFGLLNKDKKAFLVRGKIKHLPWWDFKNLFNKKSNVDCIIINHAICEMNENAIRFILKLSLSLKNRYLFIEGTGHDEFLSFEKVKMILLEYNYNIFYEKNEVYLFRYNRAKKAYNPFLQKIKNYPFIRILTKEIDIVRKKFKEKLIHSNQSIFLKNKFKIYDINKLYNKIYKDSKITSASREFFRLLSILK